MTAEEQRIVIAEFCGWTFPQEPGFELYWVIRPNGVEASPGPVELSTIGRRIPDFLNDLNAIHEAFSKLENTQQARFGEELSFILKIHDWTNCKLIIRAVMKATAAQRAEALLKAIGKWKD